MVSRERIISKNDVITSELIERMPQMVRWFDPSVLLKIIRPVFISAIFGTYADRRLIQAALDNAVPEKLVARCDVRQHLEIDGEGALWMDFVADLGDGFDPTYAIAYLLAQPALKINDIICPRGSFLVLGGDQVYPDASRKSYEERLRVPYGWAFPDDSDPKAKHPLFYAIPGNHDWYDGLDLFLAYFCKEKPGKLGNWRSNQRRSYFAIQLTEKWWLWGVDIQLSEYVDTPQEDYFSLIASNMPKGSNIILCTAVPGWFKLDDIDDKSNNSLGYFTAIARKATEKDSNQNKELNVALVLSGDTHHYSRYVAENQKTQFITAGGGGAFLHPTHQLKSRIDGRWNDKKETILLGKNEPSKSGEKTEEACYPSRSRSRLLVLKNLFFAGLNWKFSGMLGGLYAVLGLMSLMWNDLSTFSAVFTNPFWWAAVLLFWYVFKTYAMDSSWIWKGEAFSSFKPESRKFILGTIHAGAHAIAFTWLTVYLFNWVGMTIGLDFWTWGFNALFLTSVVLAGGALAGTIFGVYLLLTCLVLGTHADHAFSALSSNRYKHFLRLRIHADTVTVFPIGLDTVPNRKGWKVNQQIGNSSRVLPVEDLKALFIEQPIIVTAGKPNTVQAEKPLPT